MTQNPYISIDINANAFKTHPPNQAILRFRLKEGFKSHAVNPPLIDASDQIFNSVSASHAAEFSLLET